MTLQERAAFGIFSCVFSVCLHFSQTTAVAALQKQLLKLKHAVFVYYESDLPLRISIIILSACEPALTPGA